MRLLFTVLCLMLLHGVVSAQGIVTDRPTQAVGSTTVPANKLQVETGTYVSVLDSTNYWGISNNLFRYGIGEHLEIRLFTELARVRERQSGHTDLGISDIQVGFKYRFLKEGVEMAMVGHLIIPGGSKGFSNESVGGSVKLLASHAVTSKIAFAYNAGIDFYDSDNYAFTYAWAPTFQLLEKLGFFVELYGSIPQFEEFDAAFDTGFYYLLFPAVQLDFSFGTGITERSNLYSIGVSWRMQD